MEYVHSAYHSWLGHEGQLVHSPGDSTNFSIHLDQHLRDDRPEIFATLDGAGENHLGWNWVLSQEESLDIVVQGAPCLSTGQ